MKNAHSRDLTCTVISFDTYGISRFIQLVNSPHLFKCISINILNLSIAQQKPISTFPSWIFGLITKLLIHQTQS
ncbi:hypothetical protein M8J75_013674 [Diaphorina citri]|nr:hypothetical protein M8J75_013674 [Diaphorina citri]